MLYFTGVVEMVVEREGRELQMGDRGEQGSQVLN